MPLGQYQDIPELIPEEDAMGQAARRLHPSALM